MKYIYLAILICSLSFGQTDRWRLMWFPNSETDMAYYIVFKGSTANPVEMDSVDMVIHNLNNVVNLDGEAYFEYIDNELIYGQSIYYALKAVDESGLKSDFSEVVSAAIPLTSVPDQNFAENEMSKIIDLSPFIFDDNAEHTFSMTGLTKFNAVFSDPAMNIVLLDLTFNGSETGYLSTVDPDSFYYVQPVTFTSEGEQSPNPSQGVIIHR